MKLAIFTTSTDNHYVAYAIVGMLSYKRCYPSADVFVAGEFKESTQQLIRSCGLHVLPLSLSTTFPMRPDGAYPSECMWWLGGPEALHALGYTHSMYADPDTYCFRALPNASFERVAHIAGQPMNLLAQMLQSSEQRRKHAQTTAVKPITKVVEIDAEAAQKQRQERGTGARHVNSGVLLFNNDKLAQFGLLAKAAALMRKIRDHGQYWDGDDSFLAMLALKYVALRLNPIAKLQYIHGRVGRVNVSECSIIHLDGTRGTRKPWHPSNPSDRLHRFALCWQQPISELKQLHGYFAAELRS